MPVSSSQDRIRLLAASSIAVLTYSRFLVTEGTFWWDNSSVGSTLSTFSFIFCISLMTSPSSPLTSIETSFSSPLMIFFASFLISSIESTSRSMLSFFSDTGCGIVSASSTA